MGAGGKRQGNASRWVIWREGSAPGVTKVAKWLLGAWHPPSPAACGCPPRGELTGRNIDGPMISTRHGQKEKRQGASHEGEEPLSD